MGPEVGALEAELVEFAGVEHVVTCASGTDALFLPLLSWGVGPGDAVFVPSFTFAATAEVVALIGATPVFVDILPETATMDPESLRTAIEGISSSGLRPRAVIPVDLFGTPADYTSLNAVAEGFGIRTISDAAQSFGATWCGQRVGGAGAATATSFFPAKPLGCYGDGGAVLTNDSDLANNMRSLRAHGSGSHKYEHLRVGMNARLDTIQAAILLEKLKVFEGELEARNRIAAAYSDTLPPEIRRLQVPSTARSAWAQYTVRVRDRDEVADRLRQVGVPTAVYYPVPLHRQPAYRAFPTAPGGLPVSEQLAGDVLSLPMHPYLDPPTQQRIVLAVADAVGK